MIFIFVSQFIIFIIFNFVNSYSLSLSRNSLMVEQNLKVSSFFILTFLFLLLHVSHCSSIFFSRFSAFSIFFLLKELYKAYFFKRKIHENKNTVCKWEDIRNSVMFQLFCRHYVVKRRSRPIEKVMDVGPRKFKMKITKQKMKNR